MRPKNLKSYDLAIFSQSETMSAEKPNQPDWEEKAKKWFLVLGLIDYKQHNDLIGNVVKKKCWRVMKENGEAISTTREFAKIKENDIIVYYTARDGLIVGIFRIVPPKNNEYVQKKKNHWYVTDSDPAWIESMVYGIEELHMPPPKKYLDFKKFLDDEKQAPFKTQAISSLSKLEEFCNNIQNGICQELDSEDFCRIKNELLNTGSPYLIDANASTRADVSTLAVLLDFYNSRATSFASLFVASIFGIVALSIMAQSIIISRWFDLIPLGFSVVLYILFALAGAYTFKRYSFYGNVAGYIKTSLSVQFYEELTKPKVSTIINGKYRELSLVNFITKREQEESNFFIGILLHQKEAFIRLYILSIILLGIIVYWHVLKVVLFAI
jgi:hypothetical protein